MTLSRRLVPPLVLLLLLVVLYSLSWAQVIPEPRELSQKLSHLFSHYGLPLVILCSFLENLAGVNSYFPGALTILTAMALTAGQPAKAIATYLAIYLPALVANILSFRFGLLTRQQGVENGLSVKKTCMWIAATYWHPQLASLTAYSIGSKNLRFRTFVKCSFPISFAWSVFWAVLIYTSGLLVDFTSYLFLLSFIYAIGWSLLEIFTYLRRQSRVTHSE